jgi:homoserine kinase type II
MAVFTEVSFDEAAAFLNALNLGQLQNIKGAAGGIENTNYFVDTDQGQYVLTLFERLTFEQLPFYLHLMKHLAAARHPGARPGGRPNGDILHSVCGKPAAVVNKLRGHSELAPGGRALRRRGRHAGAHAPGRPRLQPAPAQPARPALVERDGAGGAALRHARAGRRCCAASWPSRTTWRLLGLCRPAARPVHADLFRDNVMFEDGRKLTGFFDFYFAGVDSWLFDVAVCLNDWCIDLPTGAHDPSAPRLRAAYRACAR